MGSSGLNLPHGSGGGPEKVPDTIFTIFTFGLDFGTSNSVLAIARNEGVHVADIDPKSASPKTLKSVIFFDEEDHVYVGHDAIDQYLTYGGSYGRLMQSIKAHLPDKSFIEACVFGRWLYVEELTALILRELKHRGEQLVGSRVDSVVLGRPVVFSKDKERDMLAEKRLHDAAVQAGFSQVEFLFEPVAATLAYESTLPKGKEQLVLMADFGGGTSDFVVMRLQGGRFWRGERGKDSILSVGGIPIGGDTFDSSILKHKLRKHFGEGVHYKGMRGQSLDMPTHLIDLICNWRVGSQVKTPRVIREIGAVKQTANNKEAVQNLETLVSENLGYMLFQAIESAKCRLSGEDDAVISFLEKGIVINEPMTQKEFSEFQRDCIQQIHTCVDHTLRDAGVRPEEIDLVLMTGGSSFIPVVRNVFVEKFGDEKVSSIEAFTSVGYGLGLYANSLR